MYYCCVLVVFVLVFVGYGVWYLYNGIDVNNVFVKCGYFIIIIIDIFIVDIFFLICNVLVISVD